MGAYLVRVLRSGVFRVEESSVGSWRRYVWPLLVLVVAGLIYLGMSRREGTAVELSPSLLKQYEQKWRQAGIRSYELVVVVSGAQRGEYRLKVVDGEVTEATFDGRPLDRDRASYWTIRGQFGMLARELRNAAEGGPWPAGTTVRIYGAFDEQTGRPLWWQRVVSGGSGTVTVRITTFRVLQGSNQGGQGDRGE